MKNFLTNLSAFVLGAILAGMLLELGLRAFPVPMGLYRSQDFQRWPLVNYQPHLSYTSSMSWEMRHARYGSTNNYGHLAPFDFRPKSHPVIVLGDSFVNSEMNWYRDTLQGELARLLGRPEGVYGLGADGLSLSDYLALSKMASVEFEPHAAVVLVVDGDVSESLLPQIGHYFFAQRGDGLQLDYRPLYGDSLIKRLRRLVGDSALYRYLEMNLRFSPARLFEQLRGAFTVAPRAPVVRRNQSLTLERAVIDKFLAEFSASLKLPSSCVILLFHSDTYGIVDPAEAVALKDSAQLKRYFEARALSAGYRVADLETAFRANYELNGRRMDYWPLDRHLNGRGHAIAAKAAYESLFDGETPCLSR